LDFWPGFEPKDFLLTKAVQIVTGCEDLEIVSNESVPVDVEICSTFCFESIREKVIARSKMNRNLDTYNDYICRTSFGHRIRYDNPSKKRIWYTGENLRAPVGIFDGTISFDKSDYLKRNLYFPLIYFGIDWFEVKRENGFRFTPDELVSIRSFDQKRPIKACSFASNLAPSREQLLALVSEFMPVDRYGKSVGKPVQSKKDVSQGYQFQVCNENSIYPGYVTEKLIDSWMFGNLPIWTGMVRSDLEINPESYLDLTSLNSEEIYSVLESLNDEKIERIMTAPIMRKLPTLEPLVLFLGELLNS
jgi:hypothetical protein